MRLAARHSSKIAVVNVSTPESELQFNVPVKSKCKFLFDLVVSTLGVRETWYFGLLYVDWTASTSITQRSSCKHVEGGDVERHITWLKLNKSLPYKKCSLGGVVAIRLHFLPKLFPEIVERDLIQTTTRHLFYLHVRQQLMGEREGDDLATAAVCSMSVPSNWIIKEPSLEEDLALGAYALQSEFGDFEDPQIIPIEDDISQPPTQTQSNSSNVVVVPWLSDIQLAVLPVSLTRRLTSTNLSQLKLKYKECMGMHREDAELEYLKTAFENSLVCFTYFSVTEKQKYIRGLSVSAHGLQLYTTCYCQSSPVRSIPWVFISHVSVKDKKLSIKLLNSSASTSYPVRPIASSSAYCGATENRGIMVTPVVSAASSTPTVDCFTLSRSCPGLTVQERPQRRGSAVGVASNASPLLEVTTSSGAHRLKDKSVDSNTCQQTSTLSHLHHAGHEKSQRFFCFHGNQGSHSSCSSLLNANISCNQTLPSSTGNHHLQPPTVYENIKSPGVIRGAASSLWKSKLANNVPSHQHRSTSISEVSIAASGVSHSKKCHLHFHLTSSREAALILDLCAGQHELYLRWRQPDTVEIQQMRNVAKEEKRRREIDASRLARITHEKESAVRVRNELETRCADLERKLQSSHDEQQKLVTRVHEADLLKKRIEHYLSTSHLPQMDAYGILGAGRDEKLGDLFDGAIRNGGSLGQLQHPCSMTPYFGSRFNHHDMSPLAFNNGRRHPGGGPMTGTLAPQPATILEASHYAARPEAFLVNNMNDYGERNDRWYAMYQGDVSSSRPSLYSRPTGMQPGSSMPVLRHPMQSNNYSHVMEQASHDSILGKDGVATDSTVNGNVESNAAIDSSGISRSPRTPWQHSQSTYTSPLLGGTAGNPSTSRIRSHQLLPTPFRLAPGSSASVLQPSSSHALRQPFLSSVPSLHRPCTVADYSLLPTSSLSHLSTEQLRLELANERARFTVLSDDFAQNLSLAWQQWHRAKEICCPNWYPNDLLNNEVPDEFSTAPGFADPSGGLDPALFTNFSPESRTVKVESDSQHFPHFSERNLDATSSQNKEEGEFSPSNSRNPTLGQDCDYPSKENVGVYRSEKIASTSNIDAVAQSILSSPQPCEAIIVSSKVPHLLRHASSCTGGADIKRSVSLQQRLS